MSKKLIYLSSFILVLCIVLTGTAKADLIGWWRFNEGSGDTASDSSGNGHDGTLLGTPEWVSGPQGFGGALAFHPDKCIGVDTGIFDPTNGTGQFTVALWAFWDGTGDFQHFLTKSAGWGADTMMFQFELWGGHTDATYTDRVGVSYATAGSVAFSVMPKNEWVHLAWTFDGSDLTLYVNGVDEEGPKPFSIGPDVDAQVEIGYNSNRPTVSERTFHGSLDEFRIYDHALTEDEIQFIMQGGEGFPYASGPAPADGALYEDIWASLSWRPGDFAVSHDVYFGDNFDDVNDGTGDTFWGNEAGTLLIVGFPGFPYPDGLVPGTTYYWRIDEVNDTEPNSPWKGTVWSFWIPPTTAYNPDPADGTKFVGQNVELNWTAGFGAKLHHVYFGDNFDDVNNATVGFPTAFNTYTPGTLELEKTYYWRIDEFDGAATYKGDVWSFRTLPIVPISDPEHVGWWKLDEGYGANTVDWSGYGNHGAIYNTGGWLGEGGSAWVNDPERGTVLSFNGDNSSGTYVSGGQIPAMTLTNGFTWAYWTKQHQDQGTEIPGQGNDVILGNRYGGTTSPLQFIKFTPGNFEYYNSDHNGTIDYEDVPADIWVHHAVVKDGANLTYYRNGEVAGTGITTATIDENPLYIGGDANGERWQGYISDVHIFNKALTVDEIKLVMRGDPLVAWGPNPRPGSIPYIREATPLSWSPGDMASQHDVYFGTDKDAVDNADASDTTGIYRGRQGVTIYTPPEVEWGGGPYYWRVDEYNTDATISKGNVWSFTVIDFIGIDDIEDYNDYPPDEIFSTWIDGWEVPTNGSMAGHADPPFAETSIVHGGGQSMPVYYENNFKYSEITMTLVSVRDWTEEGVGVLSLWFRGDASNAAERVYVALNGSATVYHDNSDAALIDSWTEWTIDLQEFAAQGVNLANVNTISIGFGDKNNLQPGGSGLVFFDDIRLYRPAPPEPETP